MSSTDTPAVPTGIADIDTDWLGAALATRVDTLSFEQIAHDHGLSSSLYRLHLTGPADDLPRTLVLKLPSQADGPRFAMDVTGGYRRETAFYRDIAPHAPVLTPRAYTAVASDATIDFALLLEDLAGWENADHLAGLSMSRLERCIDALAGLHAWSLTRATPEQLAPYPVLGEAGIRDLLIPTFPAGWQVFLERTTSSVPPELLDLAADFTRHALTAVDVLTQRAMLAHGDIRADNMFFDDHDNLTMVDFQGACRATGVLDIAYLVSQGPLTADRAGRDEVLVHTYVAAMAERGVSYPFDEAWSDYRHAVVYNLLYPVVALVSWDDLPDRTRALGLAPVERALATIVDVDALAVFDA